MTNCHDTITEVNTRWKTYVDITSSERHSNVKYFWSSCAQAIQPVKLPWDVRMLCIQATLWCAFASTSSPLCFSRATTRAWTTLRYSAEVPASLVPASLPWPEMEPTSPTRTGPIGPAPALVAGRRAGSWLKQLLTPVETTEWPTFSYSAVNTKLIKSRVICMIIVCKTRQFSVSSKQNDAMRVGF